MDIFGRIISVDDHVVEPPRLWQDRLPRKYQDVGPRVVRMGASDVKLGSGKVSTRFVASDPDGVGDFAVTLVARRGNSRREGPHFMVSTPRTIDPWCPSSTPLLMSRRG